MKEHTSEYIEHIADIVARSDSEAAKEILKDLHPADIAELFQELSIDQAEYLNKLLDDETAADVLMELDEDDRKKLLANMPKEDIAKQFIEHMDSDDAVDLIQELDEDVRDEVISHIDDFEQAGDIIDLLQYADDTAGGLMGTEMIIVNENWSMPECLKQMRAQAEDMDEIFNVYVVDNDNRLRGVFPLKKMITHPSISKIKHVMQKEPISVKTDTPIEDVALDFEKYDLVAMPVVDSIGRLVGRITVDDIMDQVREQNEREYQLASGLSADVETDDSMFTQTKARLPWLIIGMIGGLANSVILGNFEAGFAVNPAMALFIPLIGGTGGNVGIQSSAIVVQGLANGSLDIRNSSKQLFKELGGALINACMISLLVFVYNFFRLGPRDITTTAVSLSLFAVVIFASIFGTLVPLTLERLKIDPAIATGPFITITNDIIGMLIYMTISWSLLSAFGGTMM
ncbi:MAG: magnesium transporter [Muribaculaceae bacterium]